MTRRKPGAGARGPGGTRADEDTGVDTTIPHRPGTRRGLTRQDLSVIEPQEVLHGDADHLRKQLLLAITHLRAVRQLLAGEDRVQNRIAEADLEIAMRALEELMER